LDALVCMGIDDEALSAEALSVEEDAAALIRAGEGFPPLPATFFGLPDCVLFSFTSASRADKTLNVEH